MTETKFNNVVLRGRKIRSDANGLISLKDIQSAAGFRTSHFPAEWRRLLL